MKLSRQLNPSLQYERERHGSLYGPSVMGKDPFCCCCFCIFETLIVTGKNSVFAATGVPVYSHWSIRTCSRIAQEIDSEKST